MEENARCIHFGVCGGCRTQNIPIEEQLLLKEKSVKELFNGQDHFWPILHAAPWHYRNKMEFSFSQTKEGIPFLGLMMRAGKGRVVDLTECHLPSAWMASILSEVRLWWAKSGLKAYFPPADRGSLRTLTLREGMRTNEKMAILTTSGHPDYGVSEEALAGFFEALLSKKEFTSIVHMTQVLEKKKPTRFIERVLHGRGYIRESMHATRPLFFKIRPLSFFQPNTVAAEMLYKRALHLADLKKEETVLDLYCGTGTIGIFASFYVKNVIGIELNEECVKDAQDNIIENGILNMTVLKGDVGDLLPTGEKISTVILDPPRMGLSKEALLKLIALLPSKILYISCNPITQAENVNELLKVGYTITAIQPVDQFPHTPHTENIVLLTL